MHDGTTRLADFFGVTRAPSGFVYENCRFMGANNKMKYIVKHTKDRDGKTYHHPVIDMAVDGLSAAVRLAAVLTRSGRCGHVQRSTDGRVLSREGTWVCLPCT